jgi:hypothetical protein
MKLKFSKSSFLLEICYWTLLSKNDVHKVCSKDKNLLDKNLSGQNICRSRMQESKKLNFDENHEIGIKKMLYGLTKE